MPVAEGAQGGCCLEAEGDRPKGAVQRRVKRRCVEEGIKELTNGENDINISGTK